MWLAVGLLIICLTLIVMFRMYIDLRRIDHQHIRLLQRDVRDHEDYRRVKQLEAPKAALPDFKTAAAIQRAIDADEAWYRNKNHIRYGNENEPVILSAAQLDALKRTYMREDYWRFMNGERKRTL